MDVVIDLDLPQLLNLFLAVIFPVLVGLITTRVTSATRKAVLLAVIAFASGFVTNALAAIVGGVPFDIVASLLTGLAAFIIAVATHYGFWKPTGVSDAALNVGSKTEQRTLVEPQFTATEVTEPMYAEPHVTPTLSGTVQTAPAVESDDRTDGRA